MSTVGKAPPGVHEWRVFAVVVALLAAPALRFLTVDGSPDLSAMSRAFATAASVASLGAGVSFYIRWRLTEEHRIAWLATALTAVSLPQVYWFALMAGDIPTSGTGLLAFAVAQTVTAVALVPTLFVERLPDNRAPLAIGVLVGVAIVAVRALVVGLAPPVHGDLRTVSAILLTAATVGIVVALAQLAPPQSSFRLRLTVALGLLGLAQVTAHLLVDQAWLFAVGVVAGIVGAALLVSISVVHARRAIASEVEAINLLHRQLEHVEAGIRTERSLVHEIRGTLAGISTASRLLHQEPHIGPTRRRQIESMMDSELARLERLLAVRRTQVPHVVVDLDRTLEPLVVRQRTRGHPVRWTPSHHSAFGSADDIAEVVNVLLDNAFQHARGSGTWVDVHETADQVEIVVSDSGPGIDPALREHVFDWGRRRPGSPGEGIGLSAARRLAADQGGYLDLIDSPAPGATFVLGLQSASISTHVQTHRP